MRGLLTGLAFASVMMLGFAGASQAQTMGAYTCNESGNPPPPGTYPGSLSITEPGSCTLGAVSASGSISVGAGGTITLGALSGNGVSVQSTGGATSVSTINSGSGPTTIAGKDANNVNYFDVTLGGTITAGTTTNIIGKNITATASLASPQITSHGGGTVSLQAGVTGSPNITNDSGDINVIGNAGDSTTTSIYMSAGQSLGVGNIKVSGTVSTTSAALTNVQLLAGGNISTGAITSPNVEVLANKFGISGTSTFLLGGGGTNGISGAVTAKNTTGGGGLIDIENGYQTGTGNMTVTNGDVIATGTTGNQISLYAHGGTLILPGGKITAGGPQSQVALVGKTVNFVNGTNVSSDYTTGGSTHSVVIEADTINYAGTSVVTANGSGQDSNDPGAVFVQGYTTGTTKVNFVGATSAAKISLGADGDHTYTQVYADAISFATGGVTLHSQGTTDHGVYLTNVTDTNTTDNLTVSSGTLALDASGAKGAGGTINVDVYKAVLNGTAITLNANGPSSGNGDGGTISFSANNTSIGASAVIQLTANAASAGTGNAVYADPTTTNPVAILFKPRAITGMSLGTAAGQVSFSAMGGELGGTGGTVSILATSPISIATANAINASAQAGDSNGGWIYLNAYIKAFADNAKSITANGTGTGQGGQFLGFMTGTSTGMVNINSLIRVDGDVTKIATTTSDGLITINKIACQQWPTGFPTFPKTYWNCVDNKRATGLSIATAANKLESQLQTQLATTLTPKTNPSVQIYYMPIIDSWASYFQTTEKGTNGVYGDTINSYRVSGAFVSINTAGGTQAATAARSPSSAGSATIMQSSIIHELGHELDYIWGNVSSNTNNSKNATYLKDYNADLQSLQSSTVCSDVYLAATCQNAPIKTDANNYVRYQDLGYANSNIELFAIVFAHDEKTNHPGVFSGPPDLDGGTNSGAASVFSQTGAFIQGLIASPPAPVN